MTREADELKVRLSLLDTVVADARGRLDAKAVDRGAELSSSAQARLGHGTTHMVAALAGATGSGKSSVFNALVGQELATPGVRRPTTSKALAAVVGDGADALLDWLAVPQRHRLDRSDLGALDGLVLLDLPDHDSTAAAHRDEVDRLVEVVDVFVWIVDPQKYADAALHENYLRRFAGHGAVTVVVLNQIDRLSAAERTACVNDLTSLLAADGFVGVRVHAVSATTGEGIDALRRELAAQTAERRAVVRRIDADLDAVAVDLAAALGDRSPTKVAEPIIRALTDAATDAAGAASISHAVERAYRHRATLAVGWPLTRWLARSRMDPLRRLGLGGTDRNAEEGASAVRRTSLVADPLASARLGEATRALVRDATRDLPDAPRLAIAAVVAGSESHLPATLDATAATADLRVAPPRWWTVVGLLQRLLFAALVIGLAWLVVLFVVAWFQLPDPPTPKWHGVAFPTMLAIGGAASGFVLAVIGRRVAAIGARRRAAKAAENLRRDVEAVLRRDVISPVDGELAALVRLGESVARLAR